VDECKTLPHDLQRGLDRVRVLQPRPRRVRTEYGAVVEAAADAPRARLQLQELLRAHRLQVGPTDLVLATS